MAGCGRWLNGSAEGQVIVKKSAGGTCFYSGLQSCGSVWSCPVCASKIRQRRADDLAAAVTRWVARGGGVEFVTLTIPHQLHQALAETFEVVSQGWRQGIVAGGAWMADRRAWGVEHWVRTVEVTYGAHGWHPHLHVLLFTDRPWTPRQRALRGAALFARWARWVERAGGGRCSRAAFRIESGEHPGALGRYLAKLQGDGTGDAGGPASIGMEFTRADLKRGRAGSLAPMQLIEGCANGGARALYLWWEWEEVTRGRRCMTWSRGAHAALVGEVEVSDEEIAAEEVPGEVVAQLDADTWRQVAAWPGRDAALLARYEEGLPLARAG